MNDVLRAYGNFDVSAGFFSLITELHVKNDKISGYMKPFFKEIKVMTSETTGIKADSINCTRD